MGAQLTPEQIANWMRLFPLGSAAEAQAMHDRMQAEIDRMERVLNVCDVRGCGKPREAHGSDHDFMEPPQ